MPPRAKEERGPAKCSRTVDRLTGMEIFHGLPPSDIPHRRSLGETTDLREVLAKFWARKRFIFASVFICAGVAFAVAKLITPIYTSEALVKIMPQQSSGPATDASVQAGIHSDPEAVETEALVLTIPCFG